MSTVDLGRYDYTLPPELIAHEPAEPRESARLLVYDTAADEVTITTVADLPSFIPHALLVNNDTTVVPARLHGTVRGLPIELLVLVDQGVTADGVVRALVNRGVKVGEEILLPEGKCVVLENHERSMKVRYEGGSTTLQALLQTHGETPLPPYIDSPSPEIVRRAQYQTVFAKSAAASTAAPTASLHFTPTLLAALESAGVQRTSVTLQVGLGTFAPVYPENFERKALHEEHYFVTKDAAVTISEARAAHRPIVGVGTTVVRTLESAKTAIAQGEGVYGTTDLFIFPPYQFTYPDILMTNFHVPKSSLMCLVQAFLEHKGGKQHVTQLYEQAIAERMRFFSFGDAMLIR
jgi:S-adenosylmethionine:tRNA ribosyltransferase-isomerase